MKERFSENTRIVEKIKSKLDELLNVAFNPNEIQSHKVYQLIRRDQELAEIFPTRSDFNDFLLIQHKRGTLLKQIPNYRMDFIPPNQYKWYFYKESEQEKSDQNTQDYSYGKFTYFDKGNAFIASNGESLRSQLELEIYEKLKLNPAFYVLYDHPLSKEGKVDVVNFYIRNLKNGNFFLWEHFEGSKDGEIATQKRAWYKRQGFSKIEDQGELIFTYDDSENDIDHYLSLISKTS